MATFFSNIFSGVCPTLAAPILPHHRQPSLVVELKNLPAQHTYRLRPCSSKPHQRTAEHPRWRSKTKHVKQH